MREIGEGHFKALACPVGRHGCDAGVDDQKSK